MAVIHSIAQVLPSLSEYFVSPFQPSAAPAPSNSTVKPHSVWMECGADSDFLANCFKRDETVSPLPRSSDGENKNDDEDTTELFLVTAQLSLHTHKDKALLVLHADVRPCKQVQCISIVDFFLFIFSVCFEFLRA